MLLVAFEGWNDAGDAATTAVSFLGEAWNAEPFATIDPEHFYDFSTTRPHVQFDENDKREIVTWPENVFAAAHVPGTDLDVDHADRRRAAAAVAHVLRADHRAGPPVRRRAA